MSLLRQGGRGLPPPGSSWKTAPDLKKQHLHLSHTAGSSEDNSKMVTGENTLLLVGGDEERRKMD